MRRIAGRRPDTDAQWARDVEDRLRSLEGGSATSRIGTWVIADSDGELVACNTDGRRINITAGLGGAAP